MFGVGYTYLTRSLPVFQQSSQFNSTDFTIESESIMRYKTDDLLAHCHMSHRIKSHGSGSQLNDSLAYGDPFIKPVRTSLRANFRPISDTTCSMTRDEQLTDPNTTRTSIAQRKSPPIGEGYLSGLKEPNTIVVSRLDRQCPQPVWKPSPAGLPASPGFREGSSHSGCHLRAREGESPRPFQIKVHFSSPERCSEPNPTPGG